MQHRDRIILTKIIQEIVEAEHILQNADFEAFYHSEIMKRAICMTVINIGELVKCLSDEWSYVRYGNTVVSGVVFNGVNGDFIYDKLNLSNKDVNIVALHGQVVGYNSNENAEIISITREVDNSNLPTNGFKVTFKFSTEN